MTQLQTTIQSAVSKDGILYMSSAPKEGEPEVAGDTTYAELVAETVKLAALTDEPKVKVVLAKACIEVHKHPGVTISVVYEQGAPIVKSLQRTVRRIARRTTVKGSHHTTNAGRAAPAIEPENPRIVQVKALLDERDKIVLQPGQERRISEIDAELGRLVLGRQSQPLTESPTSVATAPTPVE